MEDQTEPLSPEDRAVYAFVAAYEAQIVRLKQGKP